MKMRKGARVRTGMTVATIGTEKETRGKTGEGAEAGGEGAEEVTTGRSAATEEEASVDGGGGGEGG